MDEHNDGGAGSAERFEEHRPHLRSVAYRMLGSLSEAEDAVQETWLRFSRADTTEVVNLGGWLTTVVSRVCLNVLRTRRSRHDEPLGTHLPDPLVTREDGTDPEHEALLADSIGLALQVVLETLAPPERLAFVLHDIFAVPFDDVAAVVGRSPAAARQLASRARRRVQGATPIPDPDRAHQRSVVDAFFAAARAGDVDALVNVLDPDVVLRSDGGARRPAASALVQGAAAVAGRAIMFAQPRAQLRPARVNGSPGVVVVTNGRALAIMGFTVSGGRIVEIHALADPDRLRRFDLCVLDE